MNSMPSDAPLSGILLMDKPQDFTSHDVVAKLRGILRMKKIGHGGTLDPLATGVLPIFLGGATRAADYAAAQDKEYEAAFRLGYTTDTQDITGKTQEKTDRSVTRTTLEQALPRFRGAQQQIPPMYSAVQVGGRRLYDLARQGKEIERPARDITVHTLELLEFDETAQSGTLRCVVSKGTYIRTLVHDLGMFLQTGAVLSALRRTRSGTFPIADCVSFSDVERAAQAGTVQQLLRPTDSLFSAYPRVELTAEGAERAARGAVVFPRQADGMPQTPGTLCRVYAEGRFWMLGRVDPLQIGGLGLFVHKNFK